MSDEEFAAIRAAIDAGVVIHPHPEDAEPLILPEAEHAVPDDAGK